MVDKQEELLKFIKQNIKIMLQTDFSETIYKENKKEFFSPNLRNKIGFPKDGEIAKTALNYLLRGNNIKDLDSLEKVLQVPFFNSNINDREYFYQKLNNKNEILEIDFVRLQDQEYKDRYKEEIKKELYKENLSEIQELVKEEQAKYDSISSLLDQEQEFIEPDIGEINKTKYEKYDPWWKQLNLLSDPFASTDGLERIPSDLYEEIIVTNDLYDKYVYYIEQIPTELFKNTIFYGQYGSGKTTLFEYLEQPLINRNIYSVLLSLSAEQDYQHFLINFKQKLRNKLINVYTKLSGSDLSKNFESISLDNDIIKLFQIIQQRYPCEGFVIFIDNIYKPSDYENTSMKFLNYLQTLKAELIQEISVPNIGFFISAPLEWKILVSEKPVYSGSVSKEEDIPMPTVDQAHKLINKRLATFAANKENCKTIRREFVLQVYRTLELKKNLTFRQFIRECLDRFERGNFDVLTANPININPDTLKRIIHLLQNNYKVNEGINEILNSDLTPGNKGICFELLIQIFLNKAYDEDSETFKKNTFYFNQLKNTGLIIKSRNNQGQTVWIISKELTEFNKIVFDKYGYSLEDYFLKLFGKRLQIEKPKIVNTRKEFTIYDKLIFELRKKNNHLSREVISLLDDSFILHKQIISEFNNPSIKTYDRIAKECHAVIRTISNAVAAFLGADKEEIKFWNNCWRYPDSLADFMNLYKVESESSNSDKLYLIHLYANAFTDIMTFLLEQIEKSFIIPISVTSLKLEEIEAFDIARSKFIAGNHLEAAGIISRLVENKLREFIYSVLLLQYGDSRLQHIPIEHHETIKGHKKQDKDRGLPISKNELTYLNRQHYYSIVIGRHGVGADNWMNTFSKIFAKWDYQKMHSYLNMFYRFNLTSAHNKEEALKESGPNIFQYLIESIDLIIMINRSYSNFIDRAMKSEIIGYRELAYFFSLDDGKDKGNLQPMSIKNNDQDRIFDIFKASKINSIDLSSPTSIEQRYNVRYQDFFAILVTLIRDNPAELDFKIIKKNDPVIVLQIK